MYNENVLQRVIHLFSTMAEVEEINIDSELLEDLGISSMDILMLMASLEEEFKISLPEKEIRKMSTVEDVVEIISALVK